MTVRGEYIFFLRGAFEASDAIGVSNEASNAFV